MGGGGGRQCPRRRSVVAGRLLVGVALRVLSPSHDVLGEAKQPWPNASVVSCLRGEPGFTLAVAGLLYGVGNELRRSGHAGWGGGRGIDL
jgi:hypothetical protein